MPSETGGVQQPAPPSFMFMAMKQLFETENKQAGVNLQVPPVGGISELNQIGRPFGSGTVTDITRSSDIYKAVIPKFLYKPPFGFPRFIDIPEIRRLAATPYVEMCISTIIDEIAAVEWDIVPKDKDNYNEEHIKLIKQFFENPNVNKESFETILRKVIRDILTIDSGVFIKVFDMMGTFKQLFVYDGGTFTKNPDIYGTFDGKAEIIPSVISRDFIRRDVPQATLDEVKHGAAYFQYGWITGARPMPFGMREVVYMMKNPRPDDLYGRSPMEVLLRTVQTLVYGIDYSHDYFADNYIPKGVMQIIGAQQDEITAFSDRLRETMRTKNEVGDWRKLWHKMPIINTEGKFIPIQFTAQELDYISQQKWFTKLVFACFGVTPSELGFTEDSTKATEIIQGRVFRRKTIRPILNLLEYHINMEVMTEFETGAELQDGTKISGIDDVKFMFKTEDKLEEREEIEIIQMKLKNGMITPNEAREELGLEPQEGGDELRKAGMFGQSPFGARMKPFEDQEGISERESEPRDREERKAFGTSSPTILGSFERMATAKQLEKVILKLLNEKKKDVMSFLKLFGGEKKLSEIKSLDDIIHKMEGAVSAETIKQTVMDTIRSIYAKAIDEKGIDFSMNFTPKAEVIDFLQKSAFESIKGMTDQIAHSLKQKMRVAIREGWSIKRIRDEIKSLFDNSKHRAEMIARTETINAEAKATYEAANQSGLEGEMIWQSTIDNLVCPRCRDLNGKTTELNTKFKTTAAQGWEGYHPTVHPQCRCSVEFKPEE